MASDIYAKPDFSTKVRYNRKQLEDTSDWKDCEVKTYHDAYESVEDTRRVQSPEQDMVANISNLQMEVKELKKHSEAATTCLIASSAFIRTSRIIILRQSVAPDGIHVHQWLPESASVQSSPSVFSCWSHLEPLLLQRRLLP
ncbi:uncharacterized protein LOC110015840 isoform X8 [Oryzias latipes]|uniref:uncharacterized protein LOC110015840 isoform X8 n=1 Tax=Oryzias latipes TaxID=8090 RepID=UPI000CE1E702|nr:uncharacterized protein LOC110015840 isoform X8 [Oryzias latipes]